MEAEVHHTEHIPEWKKDEVATLIDSINQHPVVGVVGIRGIGARQLQSMRKTLRSAVTLRVVRNNMVLRALDECGKVSDLRGFVEDQTALVLTEMNPFRLYKMLEEGRTSAPIKAGEKAQKDIVVKKGDTSFKPGPIVGDLQQAGIPAAIESGKVVIKKTVTLAKEGEAVSAKQAEMLTRLEIYPKEVGLILRAVIDEGLVLTPDVLAIDEEQYLSNISLAAQNAFNLAVNTCYPTDRTIIPIIQKAVMDARSLAINAPVFEEGVISDILARAQVAARMISDLIDKK